MNVRAIRIPRSLMLNARALIRAVENGLDAAALGAQADLAGTVAGWTAPPTFAISTPGPFRRVIGTDDDRFFWVDEGTDGPYVIRPRRAKRLVFRVGGRAKTRPRVLRSGTGARGTTVVVAKEVMHPGITPREFTTVVSEKWQRELAVTLQRAIDSEVT